MDNGSLKKSGISVLKDRLRELLKNNEPLSGRALLPSLINEDEDVT